MSSCLSDSGSLPQASFRWVLLSFQLALFQTGKVPLLTLNFFGRSLLSTRMQSWSDIPGIVSHLLTSVSLLVANKSRVFSPLVGSEQFGKGMHLQGSPESLDDAFCTVIRP